jgi:OMPG-porin 1 family
MALKKKILASALAMSALTGTAFAQDKTGWNGSVSWGIEYEEWSCTEGCATDERGGKTKVTLLNLSLRPVEGLSFGAYLGREFPNNSADADNIITEVWVTKSLPNNFWVGGVIANESGDNRLDVGIKAGGSYQITDTVDIHGYAFVKHRFKGKPGGAEGDYFEIEPGFGFKFSDQAGAWLNFRYQGWDWDTLDDEREWIVKPGVYYNPGGNLSGSLWAEIGKFEKEAVQYTEEYVKIGVSADYKLSDRAKLSGSISNKWRTDTDGLAATEKKRLYPFIGVNYVLEF